MSYSTTKSASPAKLRSGAWGAKTNDQVAVGDQVKITTAAGKSWMATVKAVVWTDGKVSIITLADRDFKAPAAKTCSVGGQRYKRMAGYCYYPCPVSGRVCSPENGACHDCS